MTLVTYMRRLRLHAKDPDSEFRQIAFAVFLPVDACFDVINWRLQRMSVSLLSQPLKRHAETSSQIKLYAGLQLSAIAVEKQQVCAHRQGLLGSSE